MHDRTIEGALDVLGATSEGLSTDEAAHRARGEPLLIGAQIW